VLTPREAAAARWLAAHSIVTGKTNSRSQSRTHIDKRSRLVSAAVGLAYQSGFGATSLADIAREAEVPLGNVYYYFKTKDDIGDAIVELRLAQLSAQRQRWNEAGSPKDRLCACVQDVFENKDFLAQRGCAVGAFCSELHKAGGSVATRATEIFAKTPTALPCICFPPCKAFRSWLMPFMTPVLWRRRPSGSRVGFKACEAPGGLNPQAHTAKPEANRVKCAFSIS
jgi:AcrR family transcriptional regulator